MICFAATVSRETLHTPARTTNTQFPFSSISGHYLLHFGVRVCVYDGKRVFWISHAWHKHTSTNGDIRPIGLLAIGFAQHILAAQTICSIPCDFARRRRRRLRTKWRANARKSKYACTWWGWERKELHLLRPLHIQTTFTWSAFQLIVYS